MSQVTGHRKNTIASIKTWQEGKVLSTDEIANILQVLEAQELKLKQQAQNLNNVREGNRQLTLAVSRLKTKFDNVAKENVFLDQVLTKACSSRFKEGIKFLLGS